MNELLVIEVEELRQRIFEAGCIAGYANPFLASELTDSVLHFLRRDFENQSPSTAQVMDSAVKFVRELGHPRVAAALAQLPCNDDRRQNLERDLHTSGDPGRASTNSIATRELAAYSRQNVYPTNIVAAHDVGIIELTDLATPFELLGGPIDVVAAAGSADAALVTAIARARARFSSFVELDLRDAMADRAEPQSWCRTLSSSLQLADLTAYVHIPSKTGMISSGNSLFPMALGDASPHGVQANWLKYLVREREKRIHPVIHVTAGIANEQCMGEMIALLLKEQTNCTFAFVRAGQPVWRVTGLTDSTKSVLSIVSANVPTLLRVLPPQLSSLAFIDRLAGLARLAFAAARARYSYLRQRKSPALVEGFLLDRSALIFAPTAVREAAESLVQHDPSPINANDLVAVMRHSMNRAANECSEFGPVCGVVHEPIELRLSDWQQPQNATNLSSVTVVTIDQPTANDAVELAAMINHLFSQSSVRALALKFA